MKKILFVTLLAIFTFPNVAKATESYNFIGDVIRSLQSAQIAGERTKQGNSNDLVSQMKDIIVFNNGILEAAQFIKPHLASNNKLIKESAGSFHFIYSSIVENNENLLKTLENALNSIENTVAKQGTFLRKISESMAANEELWRMLLYATTMSTYCLVDQNRTENGKLKFLTITTKEKKSLIDQLVGVFGDRIKGGPKGGQLPLEGSGALLYSFLGQGWKPSDTK